MLLAKWIEEDVSEAWSSHGEIKNECRIFSGKCEMTLFGRPWHTWEVNIKMNLWVVGVNWTYLAWD
jgi:hypothetical protein